MTHLRTFLRTLESQGRIMKVSAGLTVLYRGDSSQHAYDAILSTKSVILEFDNESALIQDGIIVAATNMADHLIPKGIYHVTEAV